MATITASTALLNAKSLPTNDLCVSKDYTFAAAAIADVVQVVKVPVGARVVDVDLYNDALGASTTVAVGHASSATGTVGSATYWLGATSTSSAGRTRTAARPLDITTANDLLVLTVGGGVATGAVTLTVTYTMDP